ncbi:MAG: ABC transporter substrate-binding protein [Solibacillus sp.]|uniref:ABC transporter substrate-binding protein n=1 Tax=Solibacillus sp. TaxID=1909654 RepID=UPI0033154B6E
MRKYKFLLIGALVLSLAACGEEKETVETSANSNSTEEVEQNETVVDVKPVTFKDALGYDHEFEAVPGSIATLNPGIMDILLELDANIIGRPTIHADMSSEIQAIQEIGNPHEPSFEQIVSLNPEVLIVPPSFQRFASTLEATGIKVVYENMDSLEGIKETITRYGEVFGNVEKAKQLIAEIDSAATKSTDSTKKALIVYGAPGTYLAALDNSLYGDILKAAGGNNIAADLPALDKYPTYASLSAEKIVEGNPQIIMLITHSDPNVVKEGFETQMNENAAWKNLDAVKNGQIIILPSQLFDNPGTQVVEALDYMRDLLEKAEATN